MHGLCRAPARTPSRFHNVTDPGGESRAAVCRASIRTPAKPEGYNLDPDACERQGGGGPNSLESKRDSEQVACAAKIVQLITFTVARGFAPDSRTSSQLL